MDFFLTLYPYRWVIYDLEWNEEDGRKVSKLIFILYSPDDNADNTSKFLVACNKDQLKAKIPDTNRDWQVNSWDELDQAQVIKTFQ
jgi:hypothetical protein